MYKNKKSFNLSFILFLLFLIILSLFIHIYFFKEGLTTTPEPTPEQSCIDDRDCVTSMPGIFEFNGKLTQDKLEIKKVDNNLKCIGGTCKTS
jgi:hypothetical protein